MIFVLAREGFYSRAHSDSNKQLLQHSQLHWHVLHSQEASSQQGVTDLISLGREMYSDIQEKDNS